MVRPETPMKDPRPQIKKFFSNLRTSRVFRNTLTFLGFVVLAALFWLIMALNDTAQENVEARIVITDVPDSVTFITLPPAHIHISVRDRGTSLMRTAMFNRAKIEVNFRDFAQDGVFRMSKGDFQSAMKEAFGPNASITSASIDSLMLIYTTNPGKRVPVVVNWDATTASGFVIAGNPTSTPVNVQVYSSRSVLDTITRVNTERVVRRGLDQPTTVEVRIHSLPGVRVIPDRVKVNLPVEPLVQKHEQVDILTQNVPEGENLLLFPQKATVVYYVAMSRVDKGAGTISVGVDFQDTKVPGTSRLPLYVIKAPQGVYNLELQQDSVEYTVVRN